MTEQQLLLPGIDPPPPPLPRRRTRPRVAAPLAHSLFFAVFPEPADAVAIHERGAQLHAQHALKGPLAAADRLHVNLLEVAAYNRQRPADKVAWALRAAATLAAPAFDVVFDEAKSLPGSEFGLAGGQGAAALSAFRQRLGEAMADAGFKPKPGFTPQMAVSQGAGRRVAAHGIAPVRWKAASFALIDSQGGHEVLGRWPG